MLEINEEPLRNPIIIETESSIHLFDSSNMSLLKSESFPLRTRRSPSTVVELDTSTGLILVENG